jgi:hypothetical protein
LFHDAHYFEVQAGIDEALRRYSGELHDCGLVSREGASEGAEVDGHRVEWGGLRMVTYRRGSAVAAAPSSPVRLLEAQLRASEAQLRAIQHSLTWRTTRRLANSSLGRAALYVLEAIRRRHAT